MTERVAARPPSTAGPLQRQEARLAWSLLAPTILTVSLVIILPLLAIFWISVKPVKLADLRPPTPTAYERLRGDIATAGDRGTIEYRLRNRSRDQAITDVRLTDTFPPGLRLVLEDDRCRQEGTDLDCRLGDFSPGYNERLRFEVVADGDYAGGVFEPRASEATIVGESDYVLTNAKFTLANFARVFDGNEFWAVLYATLFYTIFGTIGAIVVGLFAALILNRDFRGQGAFRGLFLFPYVSPVIAVAFTWVTLFDPFSGSANALLLRMDVIGEPINFFGERPMALIMVTVFEIWRYFPLSFLFILARMQAIDSDMYEAAEMDGASPFQQFFALSIPHLMGILSILFLLRFIWTFNKFDDIFLLTGGNAGTRTLTVNVYEQAFAISNIGAGAAVAVVIFGCLLLFSVLFFRFLNQEEGL
ncbi:MAG: sugar ABC transporter permease [Paracoccaceae bacterium]|nr:sugar ABC transporter permease [Paracoccaceae bacterium]